MGTVEQIQWEDLIGKELSVATEKTYHGGSCDVSGILTKVRKMGTTKYIFIDDAKGDADYRWINTKKIVSYMEYDEED